MLGQAWLSLAAHYQRLGIGSHTVTSCVHCTIPSSFLDYKLRARCCTFAMKRVGTTPKSGGRNTCARGIEERNLKAQGFAVRRVCGQWRMLGQKCKKCDKLQMPALATSLRYHCLFREF